VKVADLESYNLVNHDENSRLRVFRTLRITVDCNPKTLIELLIRPVAIACTDRLQGLRFGVKQEDVCAGKPGHNVDMIEDLDLDPCHVWSDD